MSYNNDFNLIDHPSVPSSNSHNPFDEDDFADGSRHPNHNNSSRYGPYGSENSLPMNGNPIMNHSAVNTSRYLSPMDSHHLGNSNYDYFDGTGIAADIDENDDFLNVPGSSYQPNGKARMETERQDYQDFIQMSSRGLA